MSYIWPVGRFNWKIIGSIYGLKRSSINWGTLKNYWFAWHCVVYLTSDRMQLALRYYGTVPRFIGCIATTLLTTGGLKILAGPIWPGPIRDRNPTGLDREQIRIKLGPHLNPVQPCADLSIIRFFTPFNQARSNSWTVPNRSVVLYQPITRPGPNPFWTEPAPKQTAWTNACEHLQSAVASDILKLESIWWYNPLYLLYIMHFWYDKKINAWMI
jgi:hypothetical protein